MSVRRLAATELQPEGFAFNRANAAWAKQAIRKYPKGREHSAVIPLLMRAQEQEGWVTRSAIEHVADMIGMPYIRALEVATFYTQFQLAPVGTKAHVQVCGTTPCMLRGSQQLIELCKRKIHPEPFHTNAKGTLSWEEVECQGACVNAPMVMIFKDTYELTKTTDKTKARTGDPWSNDKKRKMFDHSSGIEHAILFGRKFEGSGANGKPLRLMGGLREFIPAANTTVFSSAVSTSSFLDAVSPIFDWDTGAGDTRVMFMGRQAVIEMAKVLEAAIDIRTEPGNIKIYGIDFKEWTLPMGRLLVKIHPLLSRNTLYRKSAFIVDFDALAYVYLDGRDTDVFDDVQARDEDVRRGYVQTECSLMVVYGGLTMGYLGNISAT